MSGNSPGHANNAHAANARSLASILTEMKDELQEFVQTRIELLKSELNEKAVALKAAVPIAVVGVLFLATAFLTFSLALAALLAAVIGDTPYRWFFGALIVTVLWSIGGGGALLTAKRRLSRQSMVPEKTIQVLTGDKIWLQNETRNAL